MSLTISSQRCNDFNVEFVNVHLFILLNALGTIKLNSVVHCQYLVSFVIINSRQKLSLLNGVSWGVPTALQGRPRENWPAHNELHSVYCGHGS